MSQAVGWSLNQFASTRAPAIKVLALEQIPETSGLVLCSLANAGMNIECDHAHNAIEFKEQALRKAYDLVICDACLPGCNALEALRWFRSIERETPFVYFSGARWDENAALYLREGATDYVLESNLSRLPDSVRRALEERQLRKERGRLQQELRAAQDRTRMLFENHPQPMWLLDRNTAEFLDINDAAVRTYGYSRDEFLKRRLADLEIQEESTSIGSQGHPKWARRREGIHRKKDGTLISVRIWNHEVDFRGRRAWLGVAQEVNQAQPSAPKPAQFDRLSRVFRSSPIAITITSRAEGRYLDVNEAFLRLVGWGREEVIGHTSIELNVWDSPEARKKVIHDLDHRGAISSYEAFVNSKYRGRRSVQISAEIIDLEGTPYVLAVTNDVTEIKGAEAQRQQALRMEAIGRLATRVAHDFNNMLGVIIGYCDLAEKRPDREAAEKDIARIRKAAQRAANLTRRLLAFSHRQLLRSGTGDLPKA
jgi:two-component system, cell cycle sensor histidine kinase and response regulator CckA